MKRIKQLCTAVALYGLLFSSVSAIASHCDPCHTDDTKVYKLKTKELDVKDDARFYGDVQVKGDLYIDGDIKGNICPSQCKQPCFYPWPRFPDASVAAPLDLTGKVAVVTGASRGNGRAIAQALTAAGVTVIGTSRYADGFPAAGQYLKPHFVPQVDPRVAASHVPKTCEYLLTLELTDEASREAFFANVRALFDIGGPLEGKSLNILVTNAARLFVGNSLASTTGTEFENYKLGYDFAGIFQSYVWQGLFDLMPTDDYARILNVASLAAAIRAIQDTFTYDAGKAAVRSMADGFRAEVGTITQSNPALYEQFRIMNVNPNFMATTGLFPPTPSGSGPIVGGFNDPQAGYFFLTFGALGDAIPGFAQDPADLGDAAVQLLKMNEPFLDIRTSSDFLERLWQAVFCGDPNGTFPAARDCINNTEQFLQYALGYVPSVTGQLPVATTFINTPNDWDIVAAGKVEIVTGSWPLADTDAEVFLSVNGYPSKKNPTTLVHDGLFSKWPPFLPIGNSYNGTIDLSHCKSGDVVKVVAKTKYKGGKRVEKSEFTRSRTLHLVIA